MNKGTIIRTVARIVASLNTAACVVSNAIAGLGYTWLITAWAIFTIALDFAVAFFTTYYNNDYTEVACEYTGAMRAKKAELKGESDGETFLDDTGEVDE